MGESDSNLERNVYLAGILEKSRWRKCRMPGKNMKVAATWKEACIWQEF